MIKEKIFFMIIISLPCLFPLTSVADNKITYPSRAWEFNVHGRVVAMYDVLESGRVANVRIIKSSSHDFFDGSVKQQLYRWRFDKGQLQNDKLIVLDFEKPEVNSNYD